MNDDRVTRDDLPHWYRPGHAHFVTYRLADTIPATQLRAWRRQRTRLLESGPPPGEAAHGFRERVQKRFFAEYDRYLDTHADRSWLLDPRVAGIVRENLYHHHGVKYELIAWCIMSNHVHVVLQPLETTAAGAHAPVSEAIGSDSHSRHSDELRDDRSPLSAIMHSLKSFTANRANAVLGRTGRFWQAESYDHWVRDLDELERIVAYVIGNPVKAGLCHEPRLWQFSSAYDRSERDGSSCGCVGWLRDDWGR